MILLRKIYCVLLLACLLAGCAAEETFETISDDMVYQQAEPRQIRVSLPEDTVLPVMETDFGQLYFCRAFEVSVQTLPGGDLNATVQTLCGFDAADVELLETSSGGIPRFDFVWSSAGETGDQVGRAVILSDGGYHYCVAAMAPEEEADQYREIWNGMFETVALS